MSRWVVLSWQNEKAVEHARTETWAEADAVRNTLLGGDHEAVSIDDAGKWDEIQAALKASPNWWND